MNTRSIIFAIAAVCALAAVSNAHTDEAIESYAEATEFVSSFEKSGKGDSACTKVADDAVRTIKTECDSQQKVVNTAAKANQACCANGRKAVCRAKANLNSAQLKVNKCNQQLTVLQNKKITFPSISLSSLNGKCGSFYNAGVYKNARRKADQKKDECTRLSGSLKTSKRLLSKEVKAAARSRTTCAYTYQRRLNRAFTDATKVCSSKQNKKAFLRAAHMKCVLKGTKISKCKVGKAPKVSKTRQSTLSCAAINKKTICQAGPMSLHTGGGCNYEGKAGLFADPGNCGNQFAIYNMKNGGANSQYWKDVCDAMKTKSYQCPTGWKWATAAEAHAALRRGGGSKCIDNKGGRSKDPWTGQQQAAYSRCGWNQYTASSRGGPSTGYYFIFSDSYKNYKWQHAGNYLGYQNSNWNPCKQNTQNLAGIVCIRQTMG